MCAVHTISCIASYSVTILPIITCDIDHKRTCVATLLYLATYIGSYSDHKRTCLAISV